MKHYNLIQRDLKRIKACSTYEQWKKAFQMYKKHKVRYRRASNLYLLDALEEQLAYICNHISQQEITTSLDELMRFVYHPDDDITYFL